MYYVLFHYLKGQKERDFRSFRHEDDVINFLHESHKKIDVHRILQADSFYNLGLIRNEESPRMPIITNQEEPEEEVMDDEIIQENEEELAPTEEVLDRADAVIERGEKILKDKHPSWKLCPACEVNKISPWNKTGKCSKCQLARKSTAKRK